MKLKSLQIENYKSFQDTGALEFTPGFNVIVGQNNVGKSALLKAIQASALSVAPHKNGTQPPNAPIKKKSVFKYSFLLQRDELSQFLLDGADISPYMILGPQELPIDSRYFFLQHLSSTKGVFELKKKMEYAPNSIHDDFNHGDSLRAFYKHEFHRYATYPDEAFSNAYYLLPNSNHDQIDVSTRQPSNYRTHPLKAFLDQKISQIFRFDAERLNIGQSMLNDHPILKANASNLAACLNALSQDNPSLFKKLCEKLNYILPNVQYVTTPNTLGSASQVEIKIWPCAVETERADLALSLNDCGTGISQILAILYLVMTSTSSRLIVIDEPNSFLHPGAAKKLIEILSEYKQHQFIISSHSPEIIKSCDADTVLLLEQVDGVTHCRQIDSSSMHDMQSVLGAVGAKLSDVFGYDRILWVEGPTEEICFPKILKKFKISGRGTAICSVINTGDIQIKNKKTRDTVVKIYQALSQSKALMPPTVNILFDSENLKESDKQTISRETSEIVKFIPRKMYENYLLDDEAIEHALNQLPTFKQQPVAIETVTALKIRLVEAQKESIENLDAAKILSDLFSEISDTKEEFRKTRDSVLMTEWLLENKPTAFSELENFLKDILAGNTKLETKLPIAAE